MQVVEVEGHSKPAQAVLEAVWCAAGGGGGGGTNCNLAGDGTANTGGGGGGGIMDLRNSTKQVVQVDQV